VPRLLLLLTGGTLLMTPVGAGTKKHISLDEETASRDLVSEVPSLARIAELETRLLFQMDSANMQPDDWITLAREVHHALPSYDGVVVVHGTDTMAYTASALSFLLRGLGKPVVITGSQIPLARVRSDGMGNLQTALWMAARSRLPEVMLAFHHRVYRGNRATKVDASGLDAFASPNYPPLAEAGISLRVHRESALQAPSEPFRVELALSPHVAALRLYPGITGEILANFLRPPLEGLLLETYGSGNAPERRALLDVIEEATARGVVVLNVTQCLRGAVSASYQAGRALAEVGVLPGADLTPEAALAKLCWLLGRDDLSRDEVRRLLVTPLRGEMSVEAAG
jgi:60kDa lysophospholipase